MLPSGLLASPSYLWHAHWHLCVRASSPSARFIVTAFWDSDNKAHTTFQNAAQLPSTKIISSKSLFKN